MSESFTLLSLFESGGFLLIILIIALILTAILIVERWLYFRSLPSGDAVLEFLQQGTIPEKPGPIYTVLSECKSYLDENGPLEYYDEVKSEVITRQIPVLDRFLVHLAGFSSVSPFVGLLGTVFGIIKAFQSLGGDQSGPMGGLNAGIAEALVTTAAGLLVAIPATLAYNHFRKQMDQALLEMEIYASKLKIRAVRSREKGDG